MQYTHMDARAHTHTLKSIHKLYTHIYNGTYVPTTHSTGALSIMYTISARTYRQLSSYIVI